MQPVSLLRRILFVVMVGYASLLSTDVWAEPMYRVTVDTSSVAGTSGAIEFQYNFDGLAGSAVISNFIGGTPGAGLDPIGNVTGSLPGPVTLTMNGVDAFNDQLQDFTFGSSFSFNVALSGSGTFALSLWDASVAQILAGGGSQLFSTGLGGAALVIDVTPLGGTVISSGQVIAAPLATEVPEPSSLVLFGFALSCGLAGTRLFQRRTV